MSRRELERLVGTAVVNPTFCTKLLDGSRRQVMGDFELTPEEQEAVMGVEATTVQEFARALFNWLSDVARAELTWRARATDELHPNLGAFADRAERSTQWSRLSG